MSELTFIDLFAGIGGTRIGFEFAGAECVFSSERDRYAKHTYQANFGDVPVGDITQYPKDSIPHHDILVAGFPCQPFSLAGVSSRRYLNKKDGFADPDQGNLFFEIEKSGGILLDGKV